MFKNLTNVAHAELTWRSVDVRSATFGDFVTMPCYCADSEEVRDDKWWMIINANVCAKRGHYPSPISMSVEKYDLPL